jgi:flavin-dependent thymidylate synthase
MNNKVELIGWYGGDKAIARAAWTSTQIAVEEKTEGQIRDLIVNKLWNNGSGKPHKTPFERGLVEFNITCDAASHIHIIKHRHLNVNGESARYKEIKDDRFLVPEDWPQKWQEELTSFAARGNVLYHQCVGELSPILGRKRAKESARFFKTYNGQITLSVMTNMSCFYNFYQLRADEAAQKEIRDIAEQMLQCIHDIDGNPFKFTLEAFAFKK